MLKLNLLKSKDINEGHSNITKVGIVIASVVAGIIAIFAIIPIAAFVAGVFSGLLA